MLNESRGCELQEWVELPVHVTICGVLMELAIFSVANGEHFQASLGDAESFQILQHGFHILFSNLQHGHVVSNRLI